MSRLTLTRRAVLLGAAALATPARAETTPDRWQLDVAGRFALAYVRTGDPAVDAMSEAGLRGLSGQLTTRTAVEPGEPVGIDLDADDISVLSLLYWPITDVQSAPSAGAYLALDRWLRNGGLLLIDTRDGDLAGIGAPDGAPALRHLLSPLAIPPLAPIPSDHVLTRSFYLIDSFPGRYEGAPVWVEAPGAEGEDSPLGGARNDGVTPVVIGGNAWAEAWAVDRNGLPLVMMGMGYEGEYQRELAYRFGINLVMVALTGNYKSDQVHVPQLLERLGRRGGQQ